MLYFSVLNTMETKGKKILVVEDEKPMARALELKLTHVGYDVKTAFNGEMGLEILDKENFDLLILDLMMPKVDGFMVLQKLKDQGKNIPAIVLSNLSQEEDEAKARALGAKGFYVKSNTPIGDIVNHVEDMLK